MRSPHKHDLFGQNGLRPPSDRREPIIDADPKSSETDPPAANQPIGEGDDERQPEPSDSQGEPASDDAGTPAAPQVVPGKPDGEVDTRPH